MSHPAATRFGLTVGANYQHELSSNFSPQLLVDELLRRLIFGNTQFL